MKKVFILLIFTSGILFSGTSYAQIQSDKEIAKKINRAIERVRPILESDKFQKGNYDEVNECIKEIENVLIEEGIDNNLATGMIGAIFGEPFDTKQRGGQEAPGIDDLSGVGANPMAGKFGQAALNGWNDMCSQLSYLQHSGNGDIVGRNPYMAMGAADCQKLKESWGFNGSDYYNSTATNSVVGSSPKLKDGETLGHNSSDDSGSEATEETTDNSDSEATDDSTADSGEDDYSSEASYEDEDGNEKLSSDQDDGDDDDDEENASYDQNSSSDDDDDSSSDDSSYSGRNGGDSPDPAENDQGNVPMSEAQAEQVIKLTGNKNPVKFVNGKAGGSDDGRVGEKDDDDEGGTMRYTKGTMGSPDDERLENNSIHPAGGKVKTTKKTQIGGDVRVKER